MRREHRKCVENKSLTTGTKSYSVIIQCGTNETNALVEIFKAHKGERNKLVNMIEQSFLKIMSTEIKDTFSYLWFKYFFSCSLLKSQPGKFHGCMIC